MKRTLLQRRVLPIHTVGRWCSGGLSLGGAGILFLGFQQLASMELTVFELHMAVLQTLLLAASFVILALLCHFGFANPQPAIQSTARSLPRTE